ncbi:probable glycosyltransferase At5g25310 [Olea europaea var. sylvestris]|uniref:probable glycosyltransferase At5g25310 n=1 Tax=Olea europaea var. sylvestris TaxID=158386 RepID=UPI000C1D8734|nr:probable glycosyltransferase At5g25310 [Olea europaea var. sylvestris]
MATTTTTVFPLLLLLLLSAAAASPSPYLSPTTLFQNYQNMLTNFKIFIYTPAKPFTFQNPVASLFYNSLLKSPFNTQDPNEAHLFFAPFSADTSTRSLGRLVRNFRVKHPYWNRTLGADHFFLSPAGIDYSSDRNVLELKKNSVQISVFPVISGNFIPHKDITLPPLNPSASVISAAPENASTMSFLGYLKWDGETESNFAEELKKDADFLVDIERDSLDQVGNIKTSKFCLLFYGGDVAWMVEAMALGCVPVVIVDRPIQDLPLMDVLRWSDLSLLLSTRGGAKRLKEVLNSVSEEKYGGMKRMASAASEHLVWNEEPQPLDAFHMVIYQLWLRRHTIRYARRESV